MARGLTAGGWRFLAAFAGLGIALGASLASGAWALAAKHEPVVWSDWRPAADGPAGARQVARHVGGAVAARPLPLPALVVHPRHGGLHVVTRRAVGYALCGRGGACALPYDSQRERLLTRREGLELALYSLGYLDVDTVLVLLPPRPGERPAQSALLFRRADLAASLRRPFSATLGAHVPGIRELDGAVGLRIDGATRPFLYRVDRGSAGLLLSPSDAA